MQLITYQAISARICKTIWTLATDLGTIETMIRSIAHLLLILVVLACPVQCVIGGDMCCASKSTKAEAAAEQQCSTTKDCCRHADFESETSNSTGEAPHPPPQSDDDCNCDCLCKGAVSSASRIAEDCGAAMFDTVAVCGVVSTTVSRRSKTPPADPPDALSGREIRMMRMSFQV